MPDSSSFSTLFNTDIYAATGCPVDVSEEEYEASLGYLIQVEIPPTPEEVEDLLAGAPELAPLSSFEDFGMGMTEEEMDAEAYYYSAPGKCDDEMPF